MGPAFKMMLRAGVGTVLLARLFAAIAAGAAGSAMAQDAATEPQGEAIDYFNLSKPYIYPFQGADKFKLVVFGDSLAEGLWNGLRRVLRSNRQIEISSEIRRSSGFAGSRRFDWNKYLSTYLENNRVDIAIVMLGTYDNRRLDVAGNLFRPDTPRWRQAYAQNVDQFIRQFRRKKAAVYWVELPVSGYRKLNRHLRLVNEVIRERAQRLQIKYVSTWDRFASSTGAYTSKGTDLTGQLRRLRAADNLHFTLRGNAKLASLVKPVILSDLARARAARNVELTGKPVFHTDGTTQGSWKRKTRRAESTAKTRDRALTPGSVLSDSSSTPETSDAVITHAGLSVAEVARVRAGKQKRAARKKRRSVMVKVLLRGEKLEAKPGRADDFAWPAGN